MPAASGLSCRSRNCLARFWQARDGLLIATRLLLPRLGGRSLGPCLPGPWDRPISPEYGLDSQFDMRLVNHAKVVAEKLAQHLVLHRHVRLAADVITELGFQHRERRFHVAALVVMPQELVAAELVVEVHLLPQTSRFARL